MGPNLNIRHFGRALKPNVIGDERGDEESGAYSWQSDRRRRQCSHDCQAAGSFLLSYRSTSPITISMLPRITITSATV
jgi:hypothetical protein